MSISILSRCIAARTFHISVGSLGLLLMLGFAGFAVSIRESESARAQVTSVEPYGPFYSPVVGAQAVAMPAVSSTEEKPSVGEPSTLAATTESSGGLQSSQGTPASFDSDGQKEAPLAWGAWVSPGFRQEVRQICSNLGCDPNHLMAAIAFETSETFSPAIRNRLSGATGLIQFMDETARDLGTTTAALSEMSAEGQLPYVAGYFQPYRGRLTSLEDVYMAILWPRAVGRSPDFVLWSGGIAYEQNRGLDVDADGAITKQEAASLVAEKLEKGQRAANLS